MRILYIHFSCYLKMFLFTVYLCGLFYNNPPEIALCIRIYMRNLCDTCIFVLLETAIVPLSKKEPSL